MVEQKPIFSREQREEIKDAIDEIEAQYRNFQTWVVGAFNDAGTNKKVQIYVSFVCNNRSCYRAISDVYGEVYNALHTIQQEDRVHAEDKLQDKLLRANRMRDACYTIQREMGAAIGGWWATMNHEQRKYCKTKVLTARGRNPDDVERESYWDEWDIQ